VSEKKLHHFIFAITLSNISALKELLAHIHFDTFETKWPQNHQPLMNGISLMFCETQHTYCTRDTTDACSYVT